MYREYRRIISIAQPKMFIFENVLGLLSMKNDNGSPVIDDVLASFENFTDIDDKYNKLRYSIKKTVLNAKDFGVPQNRERVFLVGIREDFIQKETWEFPKGKQAEILTVKNAISDLPELKNGEYSEVYAKSPETSYQKLMRGNEKKLYNHINGINGERLLKIMAAVPEGEGRDYINTLVSKGKLSNDLFLTSGYSNTYGRLWWDKPSTTITNNLSAPSSLRCIHPKQNRALTTREGARLQSFPDAFEFIGPKKRVNMQVGNAVPPLLGYVLANSVYDFFKKIE